MKNKQFTKADLKVGYVVETATGEMFMVMPNSSCDLGLVDKTGSCIYIGGYTNSLVDPTPDFGSDQTIVAVYGYSRYHMHSLEISTRGRELLWKRPEPKKMTVAEISEALGYPVEIAEG